VSGRLSYGEGIAFWPITEIAIQAAGIAEDDPPERARAALRLVLEGVPDADVVTAHLAGVLGLADAGPVEAPWAVRRFFEAMASREPLVVVFDDIHWAEPALLDVIEHVADRSRDVPIVLLCMARPEFLDDRPGWGGGMRNAASVHLEPLSEVEADTLIENLLGHPALTQEIRERIRAAALGNPLFVEEMLEMLLDEGVLVQKEGEWDATVDLTTVHVPPAISALLAARLDRLSPPERAVLETASIVGEVFERSTVRALVPESLRPDVDRHLGSLLRKDLVRPSHSDVGGDEGYRFRHILLRDAAYDAVPKADRAELHEAFAGHLVASLAERAPEFDEFVGCHLEQAYDLRAELGLHDERTARIGHAAFERLRAAGERAFNRADMTGAASLLRACCEPARARRPEAPHARVAIRPCGGGGRRALSRIRRPRGCRRSSPSGERRRGGRVRRVQPHARADVPGPLDRRRRARGGGHASGRAVRGPGRRPRFRARVGGARLRPLVPSADEGIGDGGRAGSHVRQGGWDPLLERARASGSRRLEAGALRHIGSGLTLLGEFDEARRLVAEGRAITLELGQTIEHLASALGAARIEWLAGDVDAAAEILRESCERLDELGETALPVDERRLPDDARGRAG
jgi:hypothetical protein